MTAMTLTELLKFRRPIYNNTPLYRYMYLNEVFNYFEIVKCEALLSSVEDFNICPDDIKRGGKFEKFAGYTLDKFGREFCVALYLG